MTWTFKATPDATPRSLHFGGGRWLVSLSGAAVSVRSTADFDAYSGATVFPGFDRVVTALFAGGRWHVMLRNGAAPYAYAYYRSTDGALGAAWVQRAGDLYVGAPRGPGLESMTVTVSGRLVGVTLDGAIVTSDDGGDSWTLRHAVTGGVSSGGYGQHVAAFDGRLIFWGSTGVVCLSTDDGGGWSETTPSPFFGYYVSAVALGPKIILARDSGHEVVSGDGGATWATVDATAYAQSFTRGGALVVRTQYGPFGVQSSDDLVSWTSLTDDLPFLSLVVAGSGMVVGVDDGVYLRAVEGVAPLRLPLELVIGRVGPALALPLSLDVVDADVTAGLDGAGGWAAAPGGRWAAGVTLGGEQLHARLHGPVVVHVEVDSARTAEFAFLPGQALMPLGLIGQRVEITFAQADGSAEQHLFSGVVDVPSIDLASGVVSCVCTDQAQEVWARVERDQIDALVGGRWHVAVSGEPEDNYQYLLDRIQSVAASWALDVQQQPRVIPWAGAARTLTVRPADVVAGSVEVSLPSRSELRTRMVCRFQYRYVLLRRRGIELAYSQPLSAYLPWVRSATGETVRESVRWLTTPLVEGATGGVPGWGLEAVVLEHPDAGSYVTTRPFLDPVPRYAEGMEGSIYVIRPEVATALVLGFTASWSARWQQSITEDYTITLVNAALEQQVAAQLGEEVGGRLEAKFDVSGWEGDPQAAPVVGGGVGDGGLAWQPAGFDVTSRDEALRTLLDHAWVRLWASSRSGRVRFELPARPDLWLDTRILLEHDRVRASGKIVALEHVLDMESGSAKTSVTLAVGMPGDAPAPHPEWTLPAPPADPYRAPASAFECTVGTYVGGSADAPPFVDATMVGFSTNFEAPLPGAELYPYQLRIRGPDLAPEDRDPRETAAVATVAVAVPTDLLELI